MIALDAKDPTANVWGPYPNYDDVARFEYGRRLWRMPAVRCRLVRHWLDERHPHRDRYIDGRGLIDGVLEWEGSPEELDQRLRAQGKSLRCVAREIPPVFGSFFI